MKREEIIQLFERFNGMKILVIGDVMVDSYVWGKVDRISPEAPVPVVSVKKLEKRLGGAANVALNLKAMGAEPVLLACVGSDRSAIDFFELLKEQQLRSDGIVSLNRSTTVKTRILGNAHHLLRVDEEDDTELNTSDSKKILMQFIRLMNQEEFDAVIFEDYDKGLITEELIAEITQQCFGKKIPVAVDPKKRNFVHYKGVDLFKPNLKEIKEGLKIQVNPKDRESLRSADQLLRKVLNHKASLITLSEEGVYVSDSISDNKITAHHRNITDVSGAGDTVISVATLCLAAGISKDALAAFSNLAGGLACEKVGVVPVDKQQLLAEILRLS